MVGALGDGVWVGGSGAAADGEAGAAGGVPKGYHVHADGSLHKNEDEGK